MAVLPCLLVFPVQALPSLYKDLALQLKFAGKTVLSPHVSGSAKTCEGGPSAPCSSLAHSPAPAGCDPGAVALIEATLAGMTFPSSELSTPPGLTADLFQALSDLAVIAGRVPPAPVLRPRRPHCQTLQARSTAANATGKTTEAKNKQVLGGAHVGLKQETIGNGVDCPFLDLMRELLLAVTRVWLRTLQRGCDRQDLGGRPASYRADRCFAVVSASRGISKAVEACSVLLIRFVSSVGPIGAFQQCFVREHPAGVVHSRRLFLNTPERTTKAEGDLPSAPADPPGVGDDTHGRPVRLDETKSAENRRSWPSGENGPFEGSWTETCCALLLVQLLLLIPDTRISADALALALRALVRVRLVHWNDVVLRFLRKRQSAFPFDGMGN